jgi:SAM-dependent methyltransferase
MNICNICGNQLGDPVFISPNNCSLDSMGNYFDQETRMFFCNNCGHLQSTPLSDVEEYYKTDYNFLLKSDDEDQLYAIVDEKPLFRQDYQINILMQKLDIPQNACVLDYGCAKGAFLKKLLKHRPDLKPFFFDVSETYIPFWEKMAVADQWAVYTPKPEWRSQFDVVFTLFSLEHIINPQEIISSIFDLLKPSGTVYCIVPNPYGIYIADFLVADHVNHFSKRSLRHLFENNGFEVVGIDDQSHNVAYILVGKKAGKHVAQSDPVKEIEPLKELVDKTSKFWNMAVQKIREFEQEHIGDFAIYGAGVVGVFIASSLNDMSRVRCFVDQNPFKQGQSVLGKPVVSIDNLDSDVKSIYVGLNPDVGHDAIENIRDWQGRPYDYFFL